MNLSARISRASHPAQLRCLLLAVFAQLMVLPAQAALTLDDAVQTAQRNDPWLAGSELREQAMRARSIEAGSLPDPVVNLGFANLPTDSFDFDQEAMTQFKLGVSQRFPRGESRALDRKRLATLGEQYPHQRADRRARLAVNVADLWLEAYRARESVRLIEADRELFEQLVDLAQSSYSAALGRTRQEDLVRAQLELTRLEDRLTVLRERQEAAENRLGEWLRPSGSGNDPAASWQFASYQTPSLSPRLPEVELRQRALYDRPQAISTREIATHFANHPAIRSLDSRIDASSTGVELARQQYRPQWSLNASYGYREDDPMGRDRPDFFSIGVAFDLPLFTSNRQDQQLQSAIADTEALRTERALALRNMLAGFETQRAMLRRIEQRRELYRSQLLPQMQELAEASLTAYTRDVGDFAEVVRTRIAELNARIDALDIDIQRLKTITKLNYFFVTSSPDPAGESS